MHDLHNVHFGVANSRWVEYCWKTGAILECVLAAVKRERGADYKFRNYIVAEAYTQHHAFTCNKCKKSVDARLKKLATMRQQNRAKREAAWERAKEERLAGKLRWTSLR